MAIFKNFKCPNGNSPDDCLHVPQLINNIARYFIKKEQTSPTKVLNKANLISTKLQNVKSKNINKKRTS